MDEWGDNQDSGVLKHQLDAEDVVYKLAMTLRCYVYDPAEMKYTPPKGTKVKPYLNEEGISKLSSILRSRISNNNQYSSLTSDQIRSIRMNTIQDVWKILCVNKGDYDLDVTQLSTIINMVDDALLLFLSRTEKGKFKEFIKGLFSSSETYTEKTEQAEEPKKGIFG